MKSILVRKAGWALVALVLWAHPLSCQELPSRATLLADRAYQPALVSRIRQAQRRIIGAFFLFKVNEKAGNLPAAIARELVKASRRGVEVTVIMEGKQAVGADNQAAARLLSQGGVKVVFPRNEGAMHVKSLTVDDRYVMMGSHNLSQSALRHNSELSLVLDDPALALEVRRYLERLR